MIFFKITEFSINIITFFLALLMAMVGNGAFSFNFRTKIGISNGKLFYDILMKTQMSHAK